MGCQPPSFGAPERQRKARIWREYAGAGRLDWWQSAAIPACARAAAIAALAVSALPERRTSPGEPPQHQFLHVQLGFGAMLKGDLRDAAFGGAGGEVLLEVGRTDHVEDDIGAAAVGCGAGLGDKVLTFCS